MNSAALNRSAPQQAEPCFTTSLDWLGTAAEDAVPGIEVIELEVVEIELRSEAAITWGSM